MGTPGAIQNWNSVIRSKISTAKNDRESEKSKISKCRQCFLKETMRKWKISGSNCFKIMKLSVKATWLLSITISKPIIKHLKSYDVIMTSYWKSFVTYKLYDTTLAIFSHNEYFWSVISLCILLVNYYQGRRDDEVPDHFRWIGSYLGWIPGNCLSTVTRIILIQTACE